MTDLEKLKELLDGWGVPYAEKHEMLTRVDGRHGLGGPPQGPEWPATSIFVGGFGDTAGSPKVDGYIGFYTQFVFRGSDGGFVLMGAWE